MDWFLGSDRSVPVYGMHGNYRSMHMFSFAAVDVGARTCTTGSCKTGDCDLLLSPLEFVQ
jgi:hypothetical protein